MMNRRGFLGSIIALAAAPAIVRADALMRIVPRDAVIIVPDIQDMVRSTRFYDLGSDSFVTRIDVIYQDRMGNVQQSHVAFRGDDAAPALAVLRDHVQFHGFKPMPFPDGCKEVMRRAGIKDLRYGK